MGVVYAGRHAGDGTPVAVKTVTGRDAARFAQIRREIRALARLDHPGVVRILDQGVDEGRPWYAMQHLQGVTLRDLVVGQSDQVSSLGSFHAATTLIFDPEADGPATPAIAEAVPAGDGVSAPYGTRAPLLAILQRVCDALAYVHGEGVIHRDIKLSNIFIVDNGLPVLVDFGLAEDMGGAVGREWIDHAQRISGSPAYMSPEQIRGEILDARTDLYSLGCVLYQILTGRPPFIGSRRTIIRSQLERHAPPPGALADGIPEVLDRLVLRLLEKDRDRRIGYAESVAAAISGLVTEPLRWPGILPAPKPYLYRSAFVGRRDLLVVVNGCIRRCRAGEGSILAIAGESGAGKTRLAMEVGVMARRAGLDVISADCLPRIEDANRGAASQSPPLFVLRPLIDAVIDRCVEAGGEERDRLLGRSAAVLADYFPALREVLAITDQAPPLPSEAARQRLFEALTATLAAYAERRPLLLVLDDLQWADELTLAFLSHFRAGPLRLVPVLVMATFRSEERTPALDEFYAAPEVSGHELRRMSAREIRGMAGGMLAMPEPPQPFVDFLARSSNGNPFFIAEYLRAAVAEGVLIRNPLGHWVIGGDIESGAGAFEALPLPVSLHQLIELRLSKLSEGARQLLDVAALVGRTLDTGLLQRICDLDDDTLSDLMDELVNRQVIEPSDTADYRFIHDKIREIAEAELDVGMRTSLHRRIAIALEAAGEGSQEENHFASMGHHWAAAGEPLKAEPYLQGAARQALRLHATADAARFLSAALRELALFPVRDEAWRQETLALNESLGDVLALSGHHAAARDSFSNAARHTLDGDGIVRARLHRKAGKTWEIEHAHEEALAAYAKGEEALGNIRAPAVPRAAVHEWIQIKLNRLWIFYWLNRQAEITAELQEVRPLIEAHGLPSHRYHYFMSLVNRDNRRTRYRVETGTLEFARQMVVAAEDSGNLADIAFARFVRGFTLLFAGHLDEAEGELVAATRDCRLIGDSSGETRAVAYLVILHRRQGRVAEARELAQSLLSIASKRAMGDYIGVAHAALGWAAWRDGDGAAARRHTAEALSVWSSVPFPHPFQWTAVLTGFALADESTTDGDLETLARRIYFEPQCRLPDPLEAELAAFCEGVGTPAGGGRDRAARIVSVAVQLGYL